MSSFTANLTTVVETSPRSSQNILPTIVDPAARRVPVEIWHKILPLAAGAIGPEGSSPIWAMILVCRMWKAIIYEKQTMWSGICIDEKEMSKSGMSVTRLPCLHFSWDCFAGLPVIKRLLISLERSGSEPLSLTISAYNFHGYFLAFILRIIRSECHRFSNLAFVLDQAMMIGLRKAFSPEELPWLSKLSISLAGAPHPENPASEECWEAQDYGYLPHGGTLEKFLMAPQLKEARLHRVQAAPDVCLTQMTGLRRYQSVIASRTNFKTLRQMAELQECIIRVLPEVRLDTVAELQLGELHTLVMEYNLPPLEYLNLPALRSAYFSDVALETNIGSIISSLIRRSYAPLQRLHIDGYSLCLKELISMLELVSGTLVEFELVVQGVHDCGCAGALNEMFDRMSGWSGHCGDNDSEAQVLLPFLESLSVSIVADTFRVNSQAVERVKKARGLIISGDGDGGGSGDQVRHGVRLQYLCVTTQDGVLHGDSMKPILAESEFLWDWATSERRTGGTA